MNIMNFVVAHWAAILVILATVHSLASVVFGVIHKPKAETVFEQVWHYVMIAAGLGTRLAVSKDASVKAAVDALTGEAATLAGK